MIKRLLKKKDRENKIEAKELLTLELAEVVEIADSIFKRIDERINTLKSLESRIDSKIEMLGDMLLRVEKTEKKGGSRFRTGYHHEIHTLAKKGLKVDEIADFFDMPKGEVELILNIGKK
jgi:hypothetical protein